MKTFDEITGTSAVAGAGDNPEKIVPVYLKKRKKDREKILRRFIENRKANEARWRERIENSKVSEGTELDELSMRKKWAAGVQRAIRGPSKKRKPVYMRTTGKAAKQNIAKAQKTKKYVMGRRYQASRPKLGQLGS